MNNIKQVFLLLMVFVVLGLSYFVWDKFQKKSERLDYASNLEILKKDGVADFELPLFDPLDSALNPEKKVRLRELKTPTVLVNFWATWCTPCITEFPSLLELARRYPDKITIVAVSVDTDLSPLKGFLETYGDPSVSNFKVLVDSSGQVAKKFGTVKIPESYLLNSEFKLIRKVIDTQDWLTPSFLKFLENLWSQNP